MNMVVDKPARLRPFDLALPDQSLELLQALQADLAVIMVQIIN
jgi:hypothetical protein